jgi:hypothetical protein
MQLLGTGKSRGDNLQKVILKYFWLDKKPKKYFGNNFSQKKQVVYNMKEQSTKTLTLS